MTDRPLWRTSTRVLMHELLRREDHAAWRKLLVEVPDDLLIAELARRGHHDLARVVARRNAGETVVIAVVAPAIVRHPFEAEDDAATALYDAQAQTWVGPLGKRWPVEGGDE